jgi:hypothetical protein
MIRERNEAFGVRVYRGQERGYEWGRDVQVPRLRRPPRCA